MKNTLYALTFILFFTGSLNATLWLVGPTRAHTLPSQVSALVNNGDTIEIDPGVYNADVCAWSDDNLLIRCKTGMAHMKSNGINFGGKAIWVIQGNNTTIERIEFSLCTNIDQNGAGIRQEGQNLTVRYCYFHENQNGILSQLPSNKITIEYSEFNLNGNGQGFAHNVYIGKADTLLFRYNYSHHCKVGHELKSRANVNYILYNHFGNEVTGTGSYEIELPNGGLSVIMGNVLQQGVNGSNAGLIAYGLEGLTNAAPHNLYVVNNTLVNERNTGTFVNVSGSPNLYKAYNNIFAGNGNALNGTATTIDTVANKKLAIASAGFLNSVAYNYHLLVGSTALNTGVSAGNASSGLALTPTHEYSHPAGQSTRPVAGLLDAGAFEFSEFVSLSESDAIDNSIVVYTENDFLNIQSDKELSSAKIINLEGKLIYENKNVFTKQTIETTEWTAGVYIITTVSVKGKVTTKKILVP